MGLHWHNWSLVLPRIPGQELCKFPWNSPRAVGCSQPVRPAPRGGGGAGFWPGSCPALGVWRGRRWSGLEGRYFGSAGFGKPSVEQLGCTGVHWGIIPPIDLVFQPPRGWRGPGVLCRAMGMLCSPKPTWGAAPGGGIEPLELGWE